MGDSRSTNSIYRKYAFQWEILDGIIGGRSIVDVKEALSGMPMRSRDDADRFLRSYGFDMSDPIENAESMGNFREALDFLRKNFLKPENPSGLSADIPRKLSELSDLRDLLLMAAMSYPGQTTDTPGQELRDWACATLKVCHAIAHVDKDVRFAYYGDIQTQILDRFYKVVHRDESEKLYLGADVKDPLRVDLVQFESKPKKSRSSLLVKILHKADSLPDEVFDQVGIRFITETSLDALRVVKYLKDAMIVVPANIKPSRSRNSLIDMKHLKAGLSEIMKRVDMEDLGEEDVRNELLAFARKPEIQNENPHSAANYRSIQFTCRQLIKLTNPVFDQVRELRGAAKKAEIPIAFKKLVESIDLDFIQREIRFFYPYEIQVLDRETHEENEMGNAAHSDYKKSQVKTAMIRVMGNLARKYSHG